MWHAEYVMHLQPFWIKFAEILWVHSHITMEVALVDWESGEEVGIWVKEKLEVGDLVSDWTPYFHRTGRRRKFWRRWRCVSAGDSREGGCWESPVSQAVARRKLGDNSARNLEMVDGAQHRRHHGMERRRLPRLGVRQRAPKRNQTG